MAARTRDLFAAAVVSLVAGCISIPDPAAFPCGNGGPCDAGVGNARDGSTAPLDGSSSDASVSDLEDIGASDASTPDFGPSPMDAASSDLGGGDDTGSDAGPNNTGRPDAADADAGIRPAVSAGAQHACLLRPDGTVRCWGDNRSGQSATPPGTFATLSAGFYHNCGLRPSVSSTVGATTFTDRRWNLRALLCERKPTVISRV